MLLTFRSFLLHESQPPSVLVPSFVRIVFPSRTSAASPGSQKTKKRQENKHKTSSQCVPSMRETREKNLYLRGFWTMVAASPCPQSGHRFREAKQKRKFRKSRRRRKRVSPKHEHESGKKKEEPSGQRTDNSSCLRELFNSNLFPESFPSVPEQLVEPRWRLGALVTSPPDELNPPAPSSRIVS